MIDLFLHLGKCIPIVKHSVHTTANMAVWVVKFPRKGYKTRVLAKSQHTQRKLLYFVNRGNAKLSKSAII